MRKLPCILLSAAFAMLFVAACDSKPADRPTVTAASGDRLEHVLVDYVKDGDSFVGLYDGRLIEVRLFGIDAPERGQPFSNVSKQAASKLLDGKIITLLVRDTDRYQRLVAEVFLDGQQPSVNQQLVEEGVAWVYTRYSQDPELMAAQENARTEQRGLWSLSASERIAPWEWRARKKK